MVGRPASDLFLLSNRHAPATAEPAKRGPRMIRLPFPWGRGDAVVPPPLWPPRCSDFDSLLPLSPLSLACARNSIDRCLVEAQYCSFFNIRGCRLRRYFLGGSLQPFYFSPSFLFRPRRNRIPNTATAFSCENLRSSGAFLFPANRRTERLFSSSFFSLSFPDADDLLPL